jgi:hypothetical protein
LHPSHLRRVLLKGYKWEHLEQAYKLRATPHGFSIDIWELLKKWMGQLCQMKTNQVVTFAMLTAKKPNETMAEEKARVMLLEAVMDTMKEHIKHVMQNRQKGGVHEANFCTVVL